MANELGTLRYGLSVLQNQLPKQQERAQWASGDHPEMPFAPEGVSQEYLDLREMSRLPLIELGIRLPLQRLSVESVSLVGRDDKDTDVLATWKMWTANGMRARQRAPYRDALVHDTGIIGVWPNDRNPDAPVIRPESPLNVYVQPDAADPFSSLWAVKTWVEIPDVTQPQVKRSVAMLFTPSSVYRFTTSGPAAEWKLEQEYGNPLGRVPFVTFAPELDAQGRGFNRVDSLVPAQKNIDTMRFFLNLAAQFAAYRQRIATGYDPVVRDKQGNPVFQKDADGNFILNDQGLQVPVVRSPGRVGVDRLLAFPGVDTKVFDLDESDLGNYVTALEMLYATFASTAQVPAQYMVGDFKNVSGDLLTATEMTLLALVRDLQASYGESVKHVMNLANIARGRGDLVVDEVQWADAAPVSLSMIGDFASKVIPTGWPLEDVMRRAPGMTPQKLAEAVESAQSALQRAVAGDLAASIAGPKPDAAAD